MGALVGDYDADGSPDLYVTNFGPNVLYRNVRATEPLSMFLQGLTMADGARVRHLPMSI